MELVQLNRRPDLRNEKEEWARPDGGLVLGDDGDSDGDLGGNTLRMERMRGI